jgi:hypothetical protein
MLKKLFRYIVSGINWKYLLSTKRERRKLMKKLFRYIVSGMLLFAIVSGFRALHPYMVQLGAHPLIRTRCISGAPEPAWAGWITVVVGLTALILGGALIYRILYLFNKFTNWLFRLEK